MRFASTTVSWTPARFRRLSKQAKQVLMFLGEIAESQMHFRHIDDLDVEIRLQPWADLGSMPIPEATGYSVIERGNYTLEGKVIPWRIGFESGWDLFRQEHTRLNADSPRGKTLHGADSADFRS